MCEKGKNGMSEYQGIIKFPKCAAKIQNNLKRKRRFYSFFAYGLSDIQKRASIGGSLLYIWK